MDPAQFRADIVRQPLEDLDIHSPAAEELLMVIAAHESNLGHYVRQINGPALSPYQIEPNTYRDILRNILQRSRWRPLYRRMRYRESAWIKEEHRYEQLTQNLYLATLMARIYFYRWDESIPQRDDYQTHKQWIRALAEYAKRRWNTTAGAATVDDYVESYTRYVEEDAQ